MRPRSDPPRTPRHSPAHELTRNSILRISDTKTIQLIQEWEKEPCLWNTSLDDYPNKEERIYATKTIAQKLDVPNFRAEHVSMKFKNLRNSYCQELKKMASDENYKPKVFWFPHMDKFLKPHLQKINSYTNNKVKQHEKSTYDIKTEIDSDDDLIDWTVENTAQSEASCSNSIRIESTISEPSQSENGETSISYQNQAKKRKQSGDSIRRSVNLRRRSENGERSDPLEGNGQNRTNIIQKNTPRKEIPRPELRKDDYCNTFGNYVASLLKTLPHKKALMLQPKILELIVSVGLEELNGEESDP